MALPRLLGISGSLRRASANTAILETLREAAAAKAELRVFRLDGVPFYNGDLDTESPPAGVIELREAIRESDALVIASPEYNHGVPGVLKNALDWASRPLGRASLTGKPVLTMTASPAATGGVRAHAQLNETLISTGSPLVLRPQVVVTGVYGKLRDGRLVDETTLAFILAALDDLLKAIPAPPAVAEEQA